jgi:hypothetical protein
MSLPVNFSGFSGEELYRHFRNVCIEFKKLIKTSQDLTELEQEMNRFTHTSKQMQWHHQNSGVYHKDQGDKAIHKVWTEYKRYFTALESGDAKANPQDLLEALSSVEKLIDSLKMS